MVERQLQIHERAAELVIGGWWLVAHVHGLRFDLKGNLAQQPLVWQRAAAMRGQPRNLASSRCWTHYIRQFS